MIKVLHIVSKMDRAGQETFIMNVFRNIDRNKVRFIFLCTSAEKGDYDEEIRNLGGEIYILPQNKIKGKISKYISKIKILSDWFRDNRDKFDIVHLHTYHAMTVWVHLEACRRAKVKNVIIHSHNTMAPRRTLHKLMRIICGFYSYTKLACSKDAGIWLFGENEVNKGNVTVIYNGIDTENFKYDHLVAVQYKKELGLEGHTVLGHIGRFNYQKNHEFLIDVFKKYLFHDPNAVLLLIGKGELEEKIRKKVNSLNINGSVRFLGIRDDISRLLCAMDVFVFPSLFEGLGIVLIEAQYSGLKILASNRIPQEAIISNNIKCLPLNIDVWVENLKKICTLPRKNIQIHIYDFDIKNVACILQEKYISLANDT